MSDFSLFLPPKSDPGLSRHLKLQSAILDLSNKTKRLNYCNNYEIFSFIHVIKIIIGSYMYNMSVLYIGCDTYLLIKITPETNPPRLATMIPNTIPTMAPAK